MRNKIYIGLAAFTGISLGAFFSLKGRKNDAPDCHTCTEGKQVKKVLDSGVEDNFTTSKWTPSEVKRPGYRSLLKRFGTPEGILHAGLNVNNVKKGCDLQGDLVQYGTRQGVIDVADCKTRKHKKNALSKISKKGNILSRQVDQAQKHKEKQSLLEKKKVQDYQKQLQEDYDVTQITVINHTEDVRKVKLWGANTDDPITNPLFQYRSKIASAQVGTHPQGVVINPANDLIYVANQLSDSVSVLDVSGTLIAAIKLRDGGLVGSVSPVALAVNIDKSYDGYGTVYVIGSVSNKVYWIDRNHKVFKTGTTGNRPTSIALDGVNNRLLIGNIVSQTITVLDLSTQQQMAVQLKGVPKNIAIVPTNGEAFVVTNNGSSILVIDANNKLKTTIGPFEARITAIAYHPVTKKMYLADAALNVAIVIDTENYKVTKQIRVGINPNAIAYEPISKQLYVANQGDQDYSIIDVNENVVETKKLENFNIGLAIHPEKSIIATTDTGGDMVNIFSQISEPKVTINDGYHEDREDFQHNPTILKHLRVIASGTERLNALQLLENSIAGKEKCTTLSFRNYDSPQNFANVSELYDIDGTIIDGENSWRFKIAGKQKITFLLYHKQFEMYSLLPETARKSTGVKMSKGIPKNWLKNQSNP